MEVAESGVLSAGIIMVNKIKSEEKLCFYCTKRNLTFGATEIRWILNNTHVCDHCKYMIKSRFNLEVKPQREPGCDDD